jgi:phosphatidate cytidylyltransferase
MTRVVSGAALLLLALAVVWLAPAWLFLLVAEAVLLIALIEYVGLARASGLAVPAAASGAAAAITCAAFSRLLIPAPVPPVDLLVMLVLLGLGVTSLARWRGGPDAVGTVAASVFPVVYLGCPLGAMIAIRETRGAAALFLLMLTVIVSDTAQYYTGRAFGRRPLAPAISPKKTVEGAIGGFVCGGLLAVVVGRWWLPEVSPAVRGAVGALLVALGIAGDLFESMLKRSAGVKDSSSLIPGHGGLLDRIDALLFAAPAYYVVLRSL